MGSDPQGVADAIIWTVGLSERLRALGLPTCCTWTLKEEHRRRYAELMAMGYTPTVEYLGYAIAAVKLPPISEESETPA